MRRQMDLDNPAPFIGLEIHHGLAELNEGILTRCDLDAAASKCSNAAMTALVGDIEGACCDIMPAIRNRLGCIRQFWSRPLRTISAPATRPRAIAARALGGSSDQRRLCR
jgi:hypothetical protein